MKLILWKSVIITVFTLRLFGQCNNPPSCNAGTACNTSGTPPKSGFCMNIGGSSGPDCSCQAFGSPYFTYARASAPASVSVCGATNATPIVIQTCTPHNFASTCGSGNTCYCATGGVTMGTGVSPVSSGTTFQCHYVDSTHLSLYSLVGNTAIAGTGDWWSGGTWWSNTPSESWIGQVEGFIENTQPTGYLNGISGSDMLRLSIWPGQGLPTSNAVVLSGCPSACVITETTTFDPTVDQGQFPAVVGRHFSEYGTGTNLDTCGDGTESSGPLSPYTMASVSSTGWVSSPFACSISNGDYTNLVMSCGPAATPNDTIGGSQSCLSSSQFATTANPIWTGMVSALSSQTSAFTNYKWVFDGGPFSVTGEAPLYWAIASIYGLVDRKNTLGPWLAMGIYGANHIEEGYGQAFVINRQAYAQAANAFDTSDLIGWSYIYDYIAPYWTASEKTTCLNKELNDLDDPTVTACSLTNPDVSANTPSTTVNPHLWQLAPTPGSSPNFALAQAMDSTSITLNSSDTQPDNYYNGTEAEVLNNANYNDYTHYTYGQITGYVSSTKKATVTWQGGTPPTAPVVVSGTYTSGLTVVGSVGQWCWLSLTGGGSSTQATVTVPLTGTNTIAGSTALTITGPGGGYSSAPTSGSPIQNGSSATCTGTATVSTTIGIPYIIYDTVKTSSTTPGATVTVTWTKSTITGTISAGDAVIASNGWNQNFKPAQVECVVTSVGTNSVSCINSTSPAGGIGGFSTTTGAMAWRFIHWASGDCGLNVVARSNGGASNNGSPPSIYPAQIESQGFNDNNTLAVLNNLGAGDPSWQMAFDLAVGNDDARAGRDFTRNQSWLFDYAWRPWMDMLSGFDHNGGTYYSMEDFAGLAIHQKLMQSLLSYPQLDLTGPWLTNPARMIMYGWQPDLLGGVTTIINYGGNEGGPGVYAAGSAMQGPTFSGVFAYQPTSAVASYLRDWMTNVGIGGSSTWDYHDTSSHYSPLNLLWLDPGIPQSNFKAQPTQYAFFPSSSAACISDTGWPCNQYRSDFVVSRTGWSSHTDSLLWWDTRTYVGGYDSVQAGHLAFYKANILLGCDSNNLGLFGAGTDNSIYCDALQFAGPQSNWKTEFNQGPAPTGSDSLPTNTTEITYWSCATAGTFGCQYGDANSQFAYVQANEVNAYNQLISNGGLWSTNLINYANRSIYHSKATGGDEFISQLDDVSIASPGTSVAAHLQYLQTGQTMNLGGENSATGATICVSPSYVPTDCANLNTNRLIEETEFGGTATGGGPNQTYGLMSAVLCGTTCYLTWDTPGTFAANGNVPPYTGANPAPQPQASPSNTYSGGNGYSDRVAINAGSSAGATVTGEQTWLVVHKVMQSLSDTTFTNTGIGPGQTISTVAGWLGDQACGATTCTVYVQATGNMLRAALSFTTTFSGTAPYHIAGLDPGTYNVAVAGTSVTGSPFTVGTGDSTIHFTAGSGLVNVENGGFRIGGAVKAPGDIIIH